LAVEVQLPARESPNDGGYDAVAGTRVGGLTRVPRGLMSPSRLVKHSSNVFYSIFGAAAVYPSKEVAAVAPHHQFGSPRLPADVGDGHDSGGALCGTSRRLHQSRTVPGAKQAFAPVFPRVDDFGLGKSEIGICSPTIDAARRYAVTIGHRGLGIKFVLLCQAGLADADDLFEGRDAVFKQFEFGGAAGHGRLVPRRSRPFL